MKVRIVIPVSGTRGGRPWPARGEIMDVPDDEGADLIAAGIAEGVKQSKPETAVAAEPETATLTTKSVPQKRKPGRPRKKR